MAEKIFTYFQDLLHSLESSVDVNALRVNNPNLSEGDLTRLANEKLLDKGIEVMEERGRLFRLFGFSGEIKTAKFHYQISYKADLFGYPVEYIISHPKNDDAVISNPQSEVGTLPKIFYYHKKDGIVYCVFNLIGNHTRSDVEQRKIQILEDLLGSNVEYYGVVPPRKRTKQYFLEGAKYLHVNSIV